jgi:hypothetical protein
MSIEKVNTYLASSVNTPFFYFVGDSRYQDVKEKLSELGLSIVRVSDYCRNDDKLPDIDGLFDQLSTTGKNVNGKKMAVIGLGEYLAVRGNNEAASVLSQLKDLNLGTAKVVFLLRGINAQVKGLQIDPRFDKRRYNISDKGDCDLSITIASISVDLSATAGLRDLLIRLENGECGNIVVRTAINLDDAIFTVHKISDAYEGIRFACPGFNLQRSCGNEKQWAELMTELNQIGGSLEGVLEQHGFKDRLEADFYGRVAGLDFRNWLYFIALKIKAPTLSNSYLRFVLEKTSQFDDFKGNVLNAIIDVAHTEKRFHLFYSERKALVAKFPESDIADFVVNNRKNTTESIYKLTDNTKTEREEIIAWIARNGIPPYLAEVYPALSAYLERYVFKCGNLSMLFTDYFDVYKRQKVSNNLEDDFLAKVEDFALNRKYNRLPTRNEIIDGLNKTDTYLYWLDSLGVEYLAFISDLARSRGLSLAINIARSDLPTITSINRGFFDDWQGNKKGKNDELDDVKHHEAGGYNFENNELPIHLAKELDIITKVVDKAATELALRHYKRFLIVSDHGASRLAVLRRKEEKYETDTKGEHSGRCCKLFEPYDLPFAAEENGYLVLADYGRFKGSRAANVEVHGGASLEEVVLPVIELTLKNGDIDVSLVEAIVTVDFHTGTAITLFSKNALNDVSIVLNGTPYSAVTIDANHYRVILPDIKRAGEYPADVYAGDDLVNKIRIIAQGKSAKVNDDFNDLF